MSSLICAPTPSPSPSPSVISFTDHAAKKRSSAKDNNNNKSVKSSPAVVVDDNTLVAPSNHVPNQKGKLSKGVCKPLPPPPPPKTNIINGQQSSSSSSSKLPCPNCCCPKSQTKKTTKAAKSKTTITVELAGNVQTTLPSNIPQQCNKAKSLVNGQTSILPSAPSLTTILSTLDVGSNETKSMPKQTSTASITLNPTSPLAAVALTSDTCVTKKAATVNDLALIPEQVNGAFGGFPLMDLAENQFDSNLDFFDNLNSDFNFDTFDNTHNWDKLFDSDDWFMDHQESSSKPEFNFTNLQLNTFPNESKELSDYKGNMILFENPEDFIDHYARKRQLRLMQVNSLDFVNSGQSNSAVNIAAINDESRVNDLGTSVTDLTDAVLGDSICSDTADTATSCFNEVNTIGTVTTNVKGINGAVKPGTVSTSNTSAILTSTLVNMKNTGKIGHANISGVQNTINPIVSGLIGSNGLNTSCLNTGTTGTTAPAIISVKSLGTAVSGLINANSAGSNGINGINLISTVVPGVIEVKTIGTVIGTDMINSNSINATALSAGIGLNCVSTDISSNAKNVSINGNESKITAGFPAINNVSPISPIQLGVINANTLGVVTTGNIGENCPISSAASSSGDSVSGDSAIGDCSSGSSANNDESCIQANSVDRSKFVFHAPASQTMAESTELKSDDAMIWKCPICSHICPTYYQWQRHCQEHRRAEKPIQMEAKKVNPDKLTHICKYCNKAFAQRNKMVQHRRTHLNIKPYTCMWPECGYKAADQSTAVKHIRQKHFKLPAHVWEIRMMQLNDNRNPKDYLSVDLDLIRLIKQD